MLHQVQLAGYNAYDTYDVHHVLIRVCDLGGYLHCCEDPQHIQTNLIQLSGGACPNNVEGAYNTSDMVTVNIDTLGAASSFYVGSGMLVHVMRAK